MSRCLTELLKLQNTVSSPAILDLRTNFFQCDWYIREQFQHNANFTFVDVQFPFPEPPGEQRKLIPVIELHRDTQN